MTHPLQRPDERDAELEVGPIQKVDAGALRSVVTELKSTEHQVGEHTIEALAQPGTVAVITAVVLGPDGAQRIVSTALDESMIAQIQPLLERGAREHEEAVPCVGFHCYLDPPKKKDDDTAPTAPDDSNGST